MNRSWVGIGWYCFWLAIISFITLFLTQIVDANPWPLAVPLLAGHTLYFFESKNYAARLAALLLQLAAFVFVLISIAIMSADGTTWGNSAAFIGLFLLIPAMNSFYGAARFRHDLQLKWYAVIGGGMGMTYTAWRFHESARLKELHDRPTEVYWGPSPALQLIGISFSIITILAGLTLHFTMRTKRPIGLSVKSR